MCFRKLTPDPDFPSITRFKGKGNSISIYLSKHHGKHQSAPELNRRCGEWIDLLFCVVLGE